MKELILGGARSGKSLLAERRAAASGRKVIYLATAEARDGEMSRRIAHHRERRPADWHTVEEPLHLAARLRELAATDTCIVVDCLTLVALQPAVPRRRRGLGGSRPGLRLPAFRRRNRRPDRHPAATAGTVILVSNEVGWGIVPMHPLSRLFADEQGRLNQRVAAICEQVTLVAAGLPLTLKAPGASS